MSIGTRVRRAAGYERNGRVQVLVRAGGLHFAPC
jgi:hypothetical protein